MADYPSNLKDFKAWSKAMEDGARMERPRYKTRGSNTSGKTPNGLASRRKRRSRYSRRRRQKRDNA